MSSRHLMVLMICLTLVGCSSGKYPVTGTVTLANGTPLTKGLIVFERTEGGPPITARGNVTPEGKFSLSTEKPEDGVPLGTYRVVINPLDNSDVPDEQKTLPFDIKYVNIKTTDLTFEIKAGPNDFPIKLDAFSKKRK